MQDKSASCPSLCVLRFKITFLVTQPHVKTDIILLSLQLVVPKFPRVPATVFPAVLTGEP